VQREPSKRSIKEGTRGIWVVLARCNLHTHLVPREHAPTSSLSPHWPLDPVNIPLCRCSPRHVAISTQLNQIGSTPRHAIDCVDKRARVGWVLDLPKLISHRILHTEDEDDWPVSGNTQGTGRFVLLVSKFDSLLQVSGNVKAVVVPHI
jgi:hypothetical protein